jgi:AcrR family transcriptional regulator
VTKGQKSRASRLERASALGARLLDAALKQIRECGPDDLNLSSVALRTGVTTGAIYARYENANELVLATWNAKCATPIQEFILNAIAMSRDDITAAEEIRSTVTESPDSIAVAISILIASPRVDELEETVAPEFREWLRRMRNTGDFTNHALVVVAYVLGAMCFNAMIEAPRRDWISPLEWVTDHQDILVAPMSPTFIDTMVTEEIPFTISTGDPIRDALLTGAVSVIARSGLRRSSTSRIARASGNTQSTLFQTWKTRSELVSDLAGHVSESFAEAARPFGSAAIAGDAQVAAEGIARLLTPAARTQRRARLEFTLAAMYDHDVAERVHAADQAAVDALMQVAPQAVRLVESIRAVVLGLILLEEVMGGLSTIDFAPLIDPLLRRARTYRQSN